MNLETSLDSALMGETLAGEGRKTLAWIGREQARHLQKTGKHPTTVILTQAEAAAIAAHLSAETGAPQAKIAMLLGMDAVIAEDTITTQRTR